METHLFLEAYYLDSRKTPYDGNILLDNLSDLSTVDCPDSTLEEKRKWISKRYPCMKRWITFSYLFSALAAFGQEPPPLPITILNPSFEDLPEARKVPVYGLSGNDVWIPHYRESERPAAAFF